VRDDREEWDKTFDVCWGGVYNTTRAFLPLLLASREAHLTNTSSVNGFWRVARAELRAHRLQRGEVPVKGFTEALINDFKLNAPHVKCRWSCGSHRHVDRDSISGKILGRTRRR